MEDELAWSIRGQQHTQSGTQQAPGVAGPQANCLHYAKPIWNQETHVQFQFEHGSKDGSRTGTVQTEHGKPNASE